MNDTLALQQVLKAGVANLLIPDPAPLVTFGEADCLDWMLLPSATIHIVDQVLHEATLERRDETAVRIATFVERHPVQIRVLVTEVGRAAKDLIGPKASRGLKEAASAEVFARFSEFFPDPETPVVLLVGEDRAHRFVTTSDNVFVVDTGVFALALSKLGYIDDCGQE